MKELVWYNKLQFSTMLLMAAAMPVNFHIGLWIALSIAIATMIKIMAERKIGNQRLDRPLKIAFYAIIIYVLIHVVSLFLGGDNSVGMRVLELKSVLLIFAISFLISNTDYLTTKRIRWLFAGLWTGVVGMFIYHTTVAIKHLLGGASFYSVFTATTFDPIHHAYAALYFVCALSFVYLELSTHWKELSNRQRWLLIISAPLIIIDVIIVDSRAGMLTMLIVGMLCSLHLWITHRCWWKGMLLGITFLIFTISMESAIHGENNRLLATFHNIISAESDDARVDINKSSIKLAIQEPFTGHGVNNYRNNLAEEYIKDNYIHGTDNLQNAHNQYIETLLSTGIFGVTALLAFLFTPLIVAMATKRQVFLTLLITLIVCINLLFESMLERQMGLLFIGYIYALVLLTISSEEKKFGQVQKK